MELVPMRIILEADLVQRIDDLVIADRQAGRTLRGARKARVTRSSAARALIIRALSLLDSPADAPNGAPVDNAA